MTFETYEMYVKKYKKEIYCTDISILWRPFPYADKDMVGLKSL